MLLHSDDQLPEDHAALLQLAADVPLQMTPLVPDPHQLSEHRGVAISEAASALVDGPLVGFSTHGR
jgi:hypothetical protein